MFLTTKGRYAVMAMLDITTHNSSYPVKLADISNRQQINLGYLEQIFSKLKNKGLVSSVKGPGGGYQLAKPSDAIYLAEIIDAVGENVKMTKCGGGKACMANGKRCISHHVWEALEQNIKNYLSSITLAQAYNMEASWQ